MDKKFCDYCKKEINLNSIRFELQIWKIFSVKEENIESECDFCSAPCLGKWMIRRANEYGIYNE